MKIGLVCPYNMFNKPGGVPQFVRHLHDGLVKKGHEVKIITQRPAGFKGDPPKDYLLFGTTRTFKASGFGTEGNLGMPSDGDEMARILDEEKFDIINFHEPWLPMLAWQMVKHSKAAHVGTFHANLIDTAAGKSWTSSIFMPYGRSLLRKMHLFTATSEVASGMLINRADLSSPHDRKLIESIQYIPLGVDLSYFKPVKKRTPLSGPNTKTIVYVGRLEKRKGADGLISAFARVVKSMPNAHLIIAGSGIMHKKLMNYVDDNEIKNVTFEGYVSEDRKRKLLANAELACFPSGFGEGFGIVLLEAMAMGTPLLAGNNLGYRNVMKGFGRIGLIDPMATTDFANRIEFFLTDPQIRKAMSAWALKEIHQYDFPKIVDQYEIAYKKAITNLKHDQNGKKTAHDENTRKTIGRIFVRRHAG